MWSNIITVILLFEKVCIANIALNKPCHVPFQAAGICILEKRPYGISVLQETCRLGPGSMDLRAWPELCGALGAL